MSTDKVNPLAQQPIQEPKPADTNKLDLMSPKLPLPVPADHPSYGEYAAACILYVEAISFGPTRMIAGGLCGGSHWDKFIGPIYPKEWGDLPWKTPAVKPKGKRGRKMRQGAWEEMGLVAFLRDVGNWSWGQIRRRMNQYSGNVRSWERWKQVYGEAMRLMEAKEGSVFEAFKVRCKIPDELTLAIAAELGVKMPKIRLVTTKEIIN